MEGEMTVQVAFREVINAHKSLIGQPEKKIILVMPRHNWGDIKHNQKKKCLRVWYRLILAQDRDQWT